MRTSRFSTKKSSKLCAKVARPLMSKQKWITWATRSSCTYTSFNSSISRVWLWQRQLLSRCRTVLTAFQAKSIWKKMISTSTISSTIACLPLGRDLPRSPTQAARQRLQTSRRARPAISSPWIRETKQQRRVPVASPSALYFKPPPITQQPATRWAFSYNSISLLPST